MLMVSEEKLRELLEQFADDVYGFEISNASSQMWQKLYNDFIEECKRNG